MFIVYVDSFLDYLLALVSFKAYFLQVVFLERVGCFMRTDSLYLISIFLTLVMTDRFAELFQSKYSLIFNRRELSRLLFDFYAFWF